MGSLRLITAALVTLTALGCGRTDRIVFETERLPTFEIRATQLPPGAEGEAYEATLQLAADPAPVEVLWTVAEGSLPPGLRLVSAQPTSATLSGAPTVAGRFSFTVRAAETDGRAAQRAFTIEVGGTAELRIVTAQLPPGFVDEAYTAPIEATGGATPYAWRIIAGRPPPGVFLSASEDIAQLTGQPQDFGVFSFTVEVTDAAGARAQRDFRFQVAEPPADLTIVTEALAPAEVGTPYVVEVRAAGGTPPYTWRAFGLPDGLSMTTGGTPFGEIAGVPEVADVFLVEVVVRDAEGVEDLRVYELSVLTSAPQLRILTNTLASGRVGETYNETILAEGGVPPYRWRLRDGQVPAGLVLDAVGTPATTLAGTPQRIQSTRFEVEVIDQDGNVARRPFTVEIDPAIPPLRIVTTALADGTESLAYEAAIVADGGVPPYTWSVVNGMLPPGLSLSPTGTPDTRLAGQLMGSGNFTFDVLVQDADSRTARRTFTISVAGAPTPPRIVTTSLPNGTRCAGYSANLEVTGGFAPLTWSVVSGALPPGYALSPATGPTVTLAGYTDAPGPRTVRIQVQDALGQVDARSFTFDVADDPRAQRYIGLLGRILTSSRDIYVSNVCGATPTPAVRVSSSNGSVFSSAAAMSPDGRKLGFIGSHRQSGVQELSVVDLTGPTPSTPILVHPQGSFTRDVRVFAFSPDSQWVAFAGDLSADQRMEVYVVDVSVPTMPGTPRLVSTLPSIGVNSILELVWSPDSRYLAYRAAFEQAGRNDVYLTSVTSTTGHRRLNGAATHDADVFDIEWSPDGSGLAFISDTELDNRLDVYWVGRNLRGEFGNAVKVSTLPDSGDARPGRLGISPDGRWLSFVATTTSFADELYVVPLFGGAPGAQVRVHAPYPSSRDVVGVLWSPIAPALVYVADQDQENVNELYHVDLSGMGPSNPTKLNLPLASTGDVRTNPLNLEWSSDGRWVAFIVTDFGSTPIEAFVTDMSITPFVTRPVGPPRTSGALDARALHFSPDGSRLAVVASYQTAGVNELYTVDLSGSAPGNAVVASPALVANGDVQFGAGAFELRPDGSGLFYIADQATDRVPEAWSVPLLGPSPGASTRVHSQLSLGRSVERILVP